MTRHRFLNEGISPIPMGSTAEYTCVCGKRGTREVITRHIAEAPAVEERVSDDAIVIRDDFGGGTEAHYLPVTPRRPAASPTFTDDPSAPELPPPPSSARELTCQVCGAGKILADLPEITAWSCGHWIRKSLRPIAEAFQDMLRSAFRAGALSATSGDVFESWYQREVLQ